MRILNFLYALILTGIIVLSFVRNIHEPLFGLFFGESVMNETFFNIFSVSFFSMPIPGLVYLVMILFSLRVGSGKKINTDWYRKAYFFLCLSITFLILYFFIALLPVFELTSGDHSLLPIFAFSALIMITLVLGVPTMVLYGMRKEKIGVKN